MNDNLKKNTIKGLIWSGIERFLGQIITFALALILARLVTPEDYGVLAIVMVFITVSGLMVDAGFANALIRKQDCTDIDRTTVFYSNIAISIFLFIALWFLSPILSTLYENNQLTILIRTASVIVIINSLGIVQQATLVSNIDFKTQTVISLVSSITSGMIGVYLAYSGYGVWALITQTILLSTIRVSMLWILVRWKPLLVFSTKSFNDLFGYSYKLLLANLIVSGGKEATQLLIGNFFSVKDLGYYNYSNRLGSFIPFNLSISIQRVLFSSLSKIQDDDIALAKYFRKSLVSAMIFIFPLMSCISSLAEPIVRLLLTEEWYDTIPLFRVVSVTMSIWPLLFFNMNILLIKKHSDISLKLEIINLALRLGLVIGLYKLGILWVCIALCIAEFINFLIYAKVVEKVSTYGMIEQIRDLWYIIFAAVISSSITYYLAVPNINNSVISIVVGFVLTFTLFSLFMLLKRRTITQIINS